MRKWKWRKGGNPERFLYEFHELARIDERAVHAISGESKFTFVGSGNQIFANFASIYDSPGQPFGGG
jgi:hypothetical protein